MLITHFPCGPTSYSVSGWVLFLKETILSLLLQDATHNGINQHKHDQKCLTNIHFLGVCRGLVGAHWIAARDLRGSNPALSSFYLFSALK